MSNILVAVYGSLKKGFYNHAPFLQTSELIGEDSLVGWTMYDLGSYPAIVPSEEEVTIGVEVYSVTEDIFAALDTLEGYPWHYDRLQVTTKYGDAWIYFQHDGRSEDRVVLDGVWRESA